MVKNMRLGFQVEIEKIYEADVYGVAYIMDGIWHWSDADDNLALPENKAMELTNRIKSVIDDYMAKNGERFRFEDD